MRKLVLGARIVLGLIFVVFSANFVLNFLPPPEVSGPAGDFFAALLATGYMMEVVKLVEFVSGVLLLSGFLVPLGLVLLTPIIVNIVLFHIFLAPEGLPMAIVVLALLVFLAWSYRGAYRGVLAVRTEPSV